MNYAPEFIGVGKYTTELATYLAARGHAVDVVTALPHYPSWTVQSRHRWRFTTRHDNGVNVTRCPLLVRPGGKIWRLVAPLSFALLAAPMVLWRALRGRPHTVLCVEPTLLAAPAALLAARLVGARTVLHVQDLELDAAVATGHLRRIPILFGLARAFERAMRQRFDAVVTISDAMAARLRDQGVSIPASVLRNWIHPQPRRPMPGADEMRRFLGVPAGRRLVLYAGNLGAKQGLAVLIEAARLLRGDASVHIAVVGDGCMAGLVKAAAAGLPNLSSVGLLPSERLGSLLSAADLHVLPQDKCASDLVFPSKLGPLLMTGSPIVVTSEPCSELATWLGGAALRCRPGDGRALAAAIRDGLRRGAAAIDPERAGVLVASLDAASILPAFERRLMGAERAFGAMPQGEPTAALVLEPHPIVLA